VNGESSNVKRESVLSLITIFSFDRLFLLMTHCSLLLSLWVCWRWTCPNILYLSNVCP